MDKGACQTIVHGVAESDTTEWPNHHPSAGTAWGPNGKSETGEHSNPPLFPATHCRAKRPPGGPLDPLCDERRGLFFSGRGFITSGPNFSDLKLYPPAGGKELGCSSLFSLLRLPPMAKWPLLGHSERGSLWRHTLHDAIFLF